MTALPDFLAPLQCTFLGSDASRPRLGAEHFMRTAQLAKERDAACDASVLADSAVLLLLVGRAAGEAAIVIEERAHTLRSQPGQFALPGGRVDPEDRSHIGAALREAREEIELNPERPEHSALHALGEFAPVCMPIRSMTVVPVVAWLPSDPNEFLRTLAPAPDEVERLIAPKLFGPGSLTDPQVITEAHLGDTPVGLAFDLPLEVNNPADDAFVWGLTAALIAGLLTHLDPSFGAALSPRAKQVPPTRLLGERKGKPSR